jgi:hypothetical protein
LCSNITNRDFGCFIQIGNVVQIKTRRSCPLQHQRSIWQCAKSDSRLRSPASPRCFIPLRRRLELCVCGPRAGFLGGRKSLGPSRHTVKPAQPIASRILGLECEHSRGVIRLGWVDIESSFQLCGPFGSSSPHRTGDVIQFDSCSRRRVQQLLVTLLFRLGIADSTKPIRPIKFQ